MTASEVFAVPYEQVTSELRRRAKIINFSIIYGVSGYGLARNLSIPVGQAKEYIDQYFAKYPGIVDYMERTKEFARKHGYVETILGRRCYINSTPGDKSFFERAAINAPIQGSNADIIRMAMVKIDHALLQLPGDNIRMLLQVHDELLFEIKEQHVDVLVPQIKELMQNAVGLDLPLVVDINIAQNWVKT